MPRGGPALNISEGLDRDRAVDETGNQIAVFGRVGARPLSLAEQQKMYRREDSKLGPRLWWVSDNPFDHDVFRWTAEVPQPGPILK
jgi:hypothetical protein